MPHFPSIFHPFSSSFFHQVWWWSWPSTTSSPAVGTLVHLAGTGQRSERAFFGCTPIHFLNIQDGRCRCFLFSGSLFFENAKRILPVWFRTYIFRWEQSAYLSKVHRNMCPDPFFGGWKKDSDTFLLLIFWRDMVPMHCAHAGKEDWGIATAN